MMTIKQIFELSLKLAIAADPRGAHGVRQHLARVKKEYEDLRPKDKEYFDTDRLTNPYPDCAIHVDDGATVKRVLAGIDISSSDILLATQLNERGKKIDLVISHHPVGKALVNLHEVMEMCVEVYERWGVPIHIAEKIFEERMREVGRGLHPLNHFKEIDTARLLGVNFLTTHTTTDNLVDRFLREHLKRAKSETVGELMDVLHELPEFKTAKKYGAGPKLVAGSPKRRVGRWVVEMTGGTNPSSRIYEQLSQFGISTVVAMHMKDESMQKAGESHMNVVITGHMSSDSLGMNLFLDELEKRGIEVVPCGGLIRVGRNRAKATRTGRTKK